MLSYSQVKQTKYLIIIIIIIIIIIMFPRKFFFPKISYIVLSFQLMSKYYTNEFSW